MSKPLVHFLPGVNVTACGLTRRTSTTSAWGEVTCWSCKRTIAWKKARG